MRVRVRVRAGVGARVRLRASEVEVDCGDAVLDQLSGLQDDLWVMARELAEEVVTFFVLVTEEVITSTRDGYFLRLFIRSRILTSS